LGARDLGVFRRACHEFAALTSHLIPRHGLSVLNTVNSVNELLSLLENPHIARNTRSLLIYSAEWQRYHWWEWESGFLEKRQTSESCQSLNTKMAYRNYKKFIKLEQSRTSNTDKQMYSRALARMPALQSIRIQPLRCFPWNPHPSHQFSRLQRDIGLSPPITIGMEELVHVFLYILQSDTVHIDTMSVIESFNPSRLPVGKFSLENIRYLHVESFYVFKNEQRADEFLLAFPNLVEISLSFSIRWQPRYTLLPRASWRFLRIMRLKSVHSTEEDILSLFARHTSSLQRFCIRDSCLDQGSWQSLFNSMRNVAPSVEIEVKGTIKDSTSNNARPLVRVW
jgi:hypothetical protein